MKRQNKTKLSIIALVAVIMATIIVTPVSANRVFSDLNPDHWCYNKIIDFENKGYVCGYQDGTFRADQTITRAEYTKIVNNFFGYELEMDKDSGLKDVTSDDWFYPYVNEAVERGYITGYDDGTFRPNEPIRRQEATVILSRILGIDKEEYPADHVDGLAQYSDSDEVQEWARVAIHSYSVYNFINGYVDGTLQILQDVTRAETVELLHILEQKIVIPEKGGSGGGGGKVSRVKPPVVTAYELISGELTPVEGWVNSETKYEDGSLVKMTCETDGSSIYYTVDGGAKQTYTDPFVLPDGKYQIKANGEKRLMADSTTTVSSVNVDTVAPKVTGVKDDKTVKVTVEDYDYYNVGADEISGLNEETLKYAWFVLDEQTGDYVRETTWESFENNAEIVAPEYPGVYYLGVMGSDIAENKIGTGFFETTSNIDDNVKFPNDEESDEETNEPFVIVTETENEPTDDPSGDVSGDSTGDNLGDNSGDEEIIEIVVEAEITVIHDFDDLEESGDITKVVTGKPNTSYTVEPLTSEEYADVVNYENDGEKEIVISRNSGDNVVVINYTRIQVSVTFDGNGATEGEMEEVIIPAGTTETLPENVFEKEGYDFIGWSGDNGEIYDDEDDFTADPENKEVKLTAIWEAKSFEVTLIAGDNIDSVSGDGTYKYGSKVEISAILDSEAGYTIEFKEWSGDASSIKDKKFDDEDKTTSFTMPVGNITLEAIATKKANKDTKYVVNHWLETLSGDPSYDLDKTENKEGTTDTEAKFTPKTYEGFTYQESKTTPSGDKIITGDGKLVIDLYYTRNTYKLDLSEGNNVVSVSGAGTYKYGETVTISAVIDSGDSSDFEFDKWDGNTSDIKDDNFDANEITTTFTMPADDLDLTAEAVEIDVTLKLEVVDFEGKSSTKTSPEPGDWVEYKVTIKNTKRNDVTVDLEILSDSGDVSGDSTIEDVVVKAGKEVTKKFKVVIDDNFPVNEEFVTEVVAESKSGIELDSTDAEELTEKVSAINFRQKTDKNIVMLIDLSGSMGFCIDHPQYKTVQYYGDAITRKLVDNGTYSGDYDKTYNYDEAIDFLFNSKGEMVIDYTKGTGEPWKYHTIDSGDNSGDICDADTRIEILISALTSKNGFIDTISKGAVQNGEAVTITLVTFNGYFENNIDSGDMAQIVGTYDIGDSNLKSVIKNLKYGIHDGTYINTGLSKVLDVFEKTENSNKLLKDTAEKNVENFFIFFGDGAASDASGDTYKTERKDILDELINDSDSYFDYSYAIGFGDDFKNNVNGSTDLLATLLKDTGSDEPITAEKATDIVEAFQSIANKISTVSQTKDGILKISGTSFDDAVENDKVFPIAVMDGDTVLFKIEDTSDTEVDWADGTTIIKFNEVSGKLRSIEIDLSGTAFSDKKNLSVVFDYKEESED